jgi:hypothetical protein
VAPRVSTLRSLGIKTYVIGLSASVNRCMLGDMAVRGGTARPGCDWDHTVNGCQPDRAVRCYYQADDPATLNAALTELARQVSAEVCDGVDNDCDGQVDGMARGCATRCEAGQEVCRGGVWGACDARIPSAEVCDGVDNDCDGTIDGMTRTCQTLCGDGVETCVRGTWGGCTAPQPSVEICDNLIDEDCDGQTDEDCGHCVNGDTRPCGRDEGACRSGIQTCVDHAWGPCEGEIVPAVETCNNADDDCDGATDDGDGLCPVGQVCSGGACAAGPVGGDDAGPGRRDAASGGGSGTDAGAGSHDAPSGTGPDHGGAAPPPAGEETTESASAYDGCRGAPGDVPAPGPGPAAGCLLAALALLAVVRTRRGRDRAPAATAGRRPTAVATPRVPSRRARTDGLTELKVGPTPVRSQSPPRVRQEIGGVLLAYNLVPPVRRSRPSSRFSK